MDFQEQIRIVYTCGMCEEICEEIEGHHCIEGYNKMYIDGNNYFYPMLDDGKTIVRRSMMLGNTEKIVLDNQENVNPNTFDLVKAAEKNTRVSTAKNVRSKKLTDLETEILILEVQKRTPLWDFSLSLQQRSRETVRRLWDEVSMELNGKLNAAEIQKKFKSLRDTYRKIIQAEQHASGSARIDLKEKWKHYGVMDFLRDSCLIRPTQTNVSRDSVCEDSQEDESIADANTSNDIDRDADEHCSVASASTDTRKRSRRNTAKNTEEAVSAINRIADAMCREEPNIVLPAPPQPDEVDSMLHAAGLQLRRMPYKKRMQTLLDIVQMVHTRLMEEDIEETP